MPAASHMKTRGELLVSFMGGIFSWGVFICPSMCLAVNMLLSVSVICICLNGRIGKNDQLVQMADHYGTVVAEKKS